MAELFAIWLIATCASTAIVIVDLVRGGGQKMWIMDLVWPITALWAGPFGAWAYIRIGRQANRHGAARGEDRFAVVTARAATHCGAGCTLGDLLATAVAAAVPVAIGGHEIFGEWLYALVAAFGFGIAFQYFTIKPMRHLSRRDGLVAAIKADALSLAAWQIGMYGWMAIVRFAILDRPFDKGTPFYWVMMQVAMLAGFLVAYPVNAVLLRRGLKEQM